MTIVGRRTVLLALGSAGLVACTTVQPGPQFPELTYSHLERIRLAVASLDIVDTYRPPLADPNVEHRAPVQPAAAARRWAEDRLIASGTGGRRAVYTIKDASIVETELDQKTGIRGLVTNDQAERYDASLSVELAIFGQGGTREGMATASAKRSKTVPENITLNEREKIWFEMVESLMDDLNRELERSVIQSLRPFTS